MKCLPNRTKIVCIIIVVFLQSISFSQSIHGTNVSSRSSADTGIFQICFVGGVVSAYDEPGISLSSEVSYHNILFNISGVSASEFNILGPKPTESTLELSFLAGKKINFKFAYLSISAGISGINMLRRGSLITHGYYVDEYESKQYATIGLPIRANAVIKFYHFGIGIQFMANINRISPTFGLGPIIYIGTYNKPELAK